MIDAGVGQDSLDFTARIYAPRIEVKPKERKSSPKILHGLMMDEFINFDTVFIFIRAVPLTDILDSNNLLS
jgi:hypothetical protein